MQNKQLTLRGRSKMMISIEMGLIVLFFIMTLVEIFFTMQMNSNNKQYSEKYFLYFINRRMVQQKFLAGWSPQIGPSSTCPEGYSQTPFLRLKNFNNVALKDISNKTLKVDWSNPEEQKFFNNTFMGWNFYLFDLQEKGTDNLTLLYEYNFYMIKEVNFCTMQFTLDSSFKAMNIIPANRSCSEFFPLLSSADCGLYANQTYRMCMIKDYMSFDNGTSLKDVTDQPEEFFCPYNRIALRYAPNPQYDPNDPTSKETLWYLASSRRNLGDDPSLLDQAFYTNISPFPMIGAFYNMSSPNDTYVYYDPDKQYTYTIGEKYGFNSSINSDVISQNFADFYNQTFYHNATYFYKDENNVTYYMPSPLSDSSNSSNFYFLTDSYIKYNMGVQNTISSYSFPIISIQCFRNIFEKNSIWDIMGFFNRLSTAFYDEVSSTIFAWLFAKLFIAIWCYWKVRFSVLMDKLSNTISEADVKSEAVTFYTFKLLSCFVFVILMFGLNVISSSYNTINNWVNYIIENHCFDDTILDIVRTYGNYALDMKDFNDSIFFCVWFSIGLEIAQIIIFVIYSFTDNGLIILIKTEEDETKKLK
jgi:hypothetical protein